MSYYSIYSSSKSEDTKNEDLVFTKKEEALKVLKNFKDGRLKIFKTNEDAINYAHTGKEEFEVKFENLKSPKNTVDNFQPGPTKQLLVQFRKLIEEDKYDEVKNLIWSNPRYLVNSGITPTNLKEGPRYNAIHVCALNKKARIADLILKTVNDINFIERLHCNQETNTKLYEEMCNVLLDYYLNMPEKGRSDTPLHLAAKFGAENVIEILTSYPQCKMMPNLDNLYPKDVVCSRMKDPPKELKERILNLLEEKFYVPVIRSIDNSVPPTIGEPFSPTNPPEFNKDPMSPELKIQAYAGPIKSKDDALKFRRRWKTPPRSETSNQSILSNSPHNSSLKFDCSTPTKVLQNNNVISNHLNGNSVKTKLKFNFECGKDIGEGDENKSFTDSYNKVEESEKKNDVKLPFLSITPLIKHPRKKDLFFTYRDAPASPLELELSDFNYFSNSSDTIDNNTSFGISSLDISYKIRSPLIIESPGLKERHVKLIDTEKGLECVGRELAKVQKVGWKEYWDFLGTFCDISSFEGLEKLEAYLSSKNNIQNKDKSDDNKENLFVVKTNKNSNGYTGLQQFSSPTISNIELNAFKSNDISNISNNSVLLPQAATPYLCVEKSLQVFAKRMSKTISNNVDSIVSINDAFISELKRLESLVCSFRDDIRFLNIDFNVIHSRFANLISIFLQNSPEINHNILEKIKKCFRQIIQSRKRSSQWKPFGKGRDNLMSYVVNEKEQLQCISEMILDNLEYSKVDINIPEDIKNEQICAEIWRDELKCNCNWKSDTNRARASLKRRFERRLDHMMMESQLHEEEQLLKTHKYSNLIENNKQECYENKMNGDLFQNVIDDENENSDDDIYWSDSGSYVSEGENEELEVFYTPPESPIELKDLEFEGLSELFLISNQPTKRDWDVLRALYDVEIDKDKYPNIHQWKISVLKYSTEECESFSSPSCIQNHHQIKEISSQKLNFHNFNISNKILLPNFSNLNISNI